MALTNYGVTDTGTLEPPGVDVPDSADNPAPIKRIDPRALMELGQRFGMLFMQYRADRRIAELRWLRNQRQYLGIYDPDIEKELAPNRSRAYPRITRVKCISVLSRLMNLMFQGTENNWSIEADPLPALTTKDIMDAIQAQQEQDAKLAPPPDPNAPPDPQTGQPPAPPAPEVDLPYVIKAIQTLGRKRASDLTDLISDQLQELGGDQSYDYVALNRNVVKSGIIYGLGVLVGPYAKTVSAVDVELDPNTKQPKIVKKDIYKPVFQWKSIWDIFPDMAAKTLDSMDGHFERHIMSRSQVLELRDREDFFVAQIDKYLGDHQQGNYRPLEYETELRAMGVKINVNEMKTETLKYELLSWHGPISAATLRQCGVEVPDDKMGSEVLAELWMIDNNVIKADINPWAKLNEDVKMFHYFLFDEDDTSPVGQGLPNVIRDSQMSVSAATRMLLDNASVVCGPQIEVNTDLLRPDQDLTSIASYKVWYREGTGADAQYPAVRNVSIDAHLDDLMKVIELFMKFADSESFVGPATGGDMSQAPSEPMRTAAGASMLRGDAALPFKDIVRNFDRFTQSVILSVVQFNRLFNPDKAPEGEYNVIARGATSLIAKEVRGSQVDQLAATLTPEEKPFVDMQKLVEERFKTRDLTDMLLPDDEVAANQAQQSATTQAQQQLADQLQQANTRKLLSDAYKNITQGNKNNAATDGSQVDTALNLLQQGVQHATGGTGQPPGGAPEDQGGQGVQPVSGLPDTGAVPAGPSQIGAGGGPAG